MALKKISEKTYRDAPGLNKSLLVPFMKSPKHYLHALHNPKEPTASMSLGTCLHAKVLQPDKAGDMYAVCRKVDRRKNADKEYLAQFEAENAGKVIIDEEQNKALEGMAKSISEHPEAHRLIESATHYEQALFAEYKCQQIDHTVKLKALADGMSQVAPFMFDIKSTESADASEFAKKVRAFRYDLQQVHYQYCALLNGIAPTDFHFIAVENVEPYGVAVYRLDPSKIERVSDEWRLAIEFFGHCEAKQDFNIGYPDVSTILDF